MFIEDIIRSYRLHVMLIKCKIDGKWNIAFFIIKIVSLINEFTKMHPARRNVRYSAITIT